MLAQDVTPRILIAQTDPEVAAVIHNSLAKTNFKVDAVFDGLEVINTVANNHPTYSCWIPFCH